jgi:hypothetical protein
MRTFYYVHTGHRIGLDRFRRALAILKSLAGADVTLLTSDYRIAQEAQKSFGIEKSVGIDVVRNIPHIANRGDQLIFDSNEANPLMLEDMREYFSTFIRISDDENDEKAENELLISPYLKGEGICNAIAIDEKHFGVFQKETELSYFFGDDDYEKDLQKHFDFVSGLTPSLQLGYYYFLDYEAMLKEKFKNCFEFEEYDAMIRYSKVVLTASPQAVLDALAAGSKPIYFQREDYTREFITLFKHLNIPVIENYDKNHLTEILQTINNRNYEKVTAKCNKIANFLKDNLNL